MQYSNHRVSSDKNRSINVGNSVNAAAITVVLAAVYFGTSKLGFTMASAAEQVTVVWPPTGIALAAILLFGYRVWPGIALGALLTNYTADEPFATACGIALGNTMEALAGAWMLHHFTEFDNRISRLRDVMALVFLSAIMSAMISATIGVTSLCLGGVQPWTAYKFLWSLWWLGDAGGALIVAPMLLVWGSKPLKLPEPGVICEALILTTLLIRICAGIFYESWIIEGIKGETFIYVVFPFIIWAALRFEQHGTTFVTLATSSIAIWATVHGFGPFTGTSVEQSLMQLQSFMAVVAVTGLFLGAAITERRLASEAQGLLAAIVESSEDAIISKTLDGIITSWNKGAQRLFGYSAVEAIGQPITLIIPYERLDEEVNMQSWLHHREHVEHYETVRMAKDGHALDVSLTISPIIGSTGRIIGTSKVVRDITQRKQAEEALKEADRRKDQFLALLSHELRNPLATLHNALCILQAPKANETQYSEARDIIANQLEQITRLVDDLLDVSRISHRKLKLHKQPVTLAKAVHNAIETVKPFIEARGHRLIINLTQHPVWLEADLVRLSQIFTNLLHNAAKYTPPGGKIWLETEAKENTVEVRIRDTGVGIPETMLSNIFTLFTQVDNSIELAQGGMGIGLTLVKNLVEMHDGSVEVHSKGINQGSEFVVRLSQIAPPQTTDDHPSRIQASDSKLSTDKLRVLIVDDNKTLVKTLGWMVESLGHEVRLAHNGKDALDTALSFLPHVILLDIGLPEMSGYDVCLKLREEPELKHSIIVAQSGWDQPEHRKRSKEVGFHYYLVKPARLHTLKDLFSSIIRPLQ